MYSFGAWEFSNPFKIGVTQIIFFLLQEWYAKWLENNLEPVAEPGLDGREVET